jgi:hypothetical protein
MAMFSATKSLLQQLSLKHNITNLYDCMNAFNKNGVLRFGVHNGPFVSMQGHNITYKRCSYRNLNPGRRNENPS